MFLFVVTAPFCFSETLDSSTLGDSILSAENSSIIIKEQSYGMIVYDLEDDVKEEVANGEIDRSMVTEEMQIVLNCESKNKHYNLDGTIKRGLHGEWGIAQFMLKTWNWFSDLSGTDMSILDEQSQLILMRWAFDHNLKSHWSCYKLMYGNI